MLLKLFRLAGGRRLPNQWLKPNQLIDHIVRAMGSRLFIWEATTPDIHLQMAAKTGAATGGKPGDLRKVDQRVEKKLRFQLCPGRTNGVGISSVPYKVKRKGTIVYEGQTDAHGDAKFEIAKGETIYLEIFDSVYAVTLYDKPADYGRRPPQISSTTDRTGLQSRMEVLGYMTGYQRQARGSTNVDIGNDDPQTQQALMNFAVDQHLTADGELSAALATRLDREVG